MLLRHCDQCVDEGIAGRVEGAAEQRQVLDIRARRQAVGRVALDRVHAAALGLRQQLDELSVATLTR
jgi:hypothetical protein